MNIKEFYQLLSKNKITIDDNHHAFNLTRFIDNIKYQIEYNVIKMKLIFVM